MVSCNKFVIRLEKNHTVRENYTVSDIFGPGASEWV